MTDTLTTSFDRPIPVEALEALLKQTEWGAERPREKLQTLLDHSLWVGAWQGERLVGFARAVTDHVYRAFIEDVVIDGSLRGQGIGSVLVQHLIDRLAHVEQIELACGDHLIAFYERLGFARIGMTHMNIWRGKR